jgi:alkylation response protein AidB-like acyl-CoA dehydrogenase
VCVTDAKLPEPRQATTAHGLHARISAFLAAFPPAAVDAAAFREAQFDHGLAWVHLPEDMGGLGLSPQDQTEVDEALAAAGAPAPPDDSVIALGMAGPVIAKHGTREQQERYLRPLFAGREVWCQLFSEPGAGSDIAAVSATARWDEGSWVLNGQKVWTSLAHVADFGLLAARTDPHKPKHQGITYFLLDMRTPGVEVRPLRQMTGDAEFNEVFFTDVRIPDRQRVGAVGHGWAVMITTLMNERVMIGEALQRGGGPINEAMSLWGESVDKSPSLRARLIGLWMEAECHRLTLARAAERAQSGTPGPEGAVGKLVATQLNQHVYDFCMDLLGPDGAVYAARPADPPDPPRDRADIRWKFLRSKANTIEGGTSEILRNILSERILGLPQDLRVDRDVPWSDIPQS